MVATCPEIWAIRSGPPTWSAASRPEDPADIGQRAVYHEPGFLDAKPERGRWINALGRDIAGLVTVALPADGKIDLYSDQLTGGRTNVLVDIVGYTTG